MGDVTNLRQARKRRARARARVQADENAVRHGRSKARKALEEAQEARLVRRHDAHRVEDD